MTQDAQYYHYNLGADYEPASSISTITPSNVRDKKLEIDRSVLGTEAAIAHCQTLPDSLRVEWMSFRAQWAVFMQAKSWELPLITPPFTNPLGIGSAAQDMDQALAYQDHLHDLQLRISKFCADVPFIRSSSESNPGLVDQVRRELGKATEKPVGALDRALTVFKWAAILGGGVLAIWAVWGIWHAKKQAESSERLARETLSRFP
jgi:hypothetical protein